MGYPDETPHMARSSIVSFQAQKNLQRLEEKLTLFQITKYTAIKLPYVEKPSGYSLFAHEIVPIPKSWAAMSCNIVSFNQHERGGHFAVSHIRCDPFLTFTDVA